MVDNYRDLLSSVMDTHLSTVSNRLNVVMKQLTIIATIFLPLSFLTGFFGQNFGYLVRDIIAPTWTLLGARRRARRRHGGLPRRALPPPGLDGRPDRSDGPGQRRSARREERAGPAGARPCGPRSRVHQSSQPSGTGKPSCLRRSTRARTVLLVLADEGERPGVVVADPARRAQSDSSRRQASRRASTMAWVPSAMSARMSASPSARRSAARSQP